MKVKLCGMRCVEDIAAANKAAPDYIGFVFAANSSRWVSFEEAAEMKKMLDKNIKAAGVFVNQPIEDVLKLYKNNVIDVIQLHGEESGSYINALKEAAPNAVIIKAFRIGSPDGREDLEKSWEYDTADYFLFDTYEKKHRGGTGLPINAHLIPETSKPYFLAGGLNCSNVLMILRSIEKKGLKLPFAADVSSGIESEGAKDPALMTTFTNIVKNWKGYK